MKKIAYLLTACFCLISATALFAQDTGQIFELSPDRETVDTRFTVNATVMDNDTWCLVEWPDPGGYNPELWFDDGEADDLFMYATAGSMNALKFIPYFDNYLVTGGRIYVGDGAYPGPFIGTSFRVLVYDDDGADGLPGTVIDSTDVMVNNYEWVEFEGLTAQFAEGNFYLAMKQIADVPDAAPIGVDLDNPTYFNSYCYFQETSNWVLSPLQDFMIRARITGYNEPSREIDSFEVARFCCFEIDESPLEGDTTVLDAITLSEYDDYEWDALDPGLYAYGVKTHFTNGEWSDYDVSNNVIHLYYLYPSSCFYQENDVLLIACPPLDTNGNIPENLIGFNLYQDMEFVEFIPFMPEPPPFPIEIDISGLGPGKYLFGLTAVYDLSSYGFPGETCESAALITEVIISYGHPLPFLEDWIYGNFETNNWQPEGDNWSLNGWEGNQPPAAEFTWDPIQTDYQVSLESYPLLADSITVGDIYLDFDLKLDNFQPTGTEQMLVQIWNWDSQEWTTVSTYSNEDGSFDWMAEHLKITSQARGKVFKIRFTSTGESSLNIVGWYVDNIHVYRECQAPYNLAVEAAYIQNKFGNLLEWEKPYGPLSEWIEWDDGVNSGNSIGTGSEAEFDVAVRWIPQQLYEYEGAIVERVAFFPSEAATEYRIRVWIGADASTMVVDQLVNDLIIGQWNDIILTSPATIDITQELWVGYHVNTQTGYPAGVDDGPAIDGYGNMMNFGGWQTLLEINPDLDYNWNIRAFIHRTTSTDTVAQYAIYLSYEGSPYNLRAYSDEEEYFDVLFSCHDYYLYCYQVTAIYSSQLDSCESGASNEACEISPINIKEAQKANSIEIYPNPASGVLFIESEEEIESVSIFDCLGITIEHWNPGTLEPWNHGTVDQTNGRSGDQARGYFVKVPVDGLTPGLYLVRVETGSGVVGRKVVIGR